jgi:FeS assembly protein IscX
LEPLTWADVYEIALRLAERHRALDPLDLELAEVEQMVLDLPEFVETGADAENGVIEAIRSAWREEARSEGQGS